MLFLITGLIVLWLASAGLKTFLRASPAAMARLMRRSGGIACMAAAVLLVMRGQIDVGIGLGVLSLWLLKGRTPSLFQAFGLRMPRKARKVSRVRSAMIEMELDHATGVMTGTVLVGPDEGTALDQLSPTRCMALFKRCLDDDAEGARLLEAYFDRRFPAWRETAQGGADPRRGDASDRGRGRPGAMSEDEAHEVLGLAKSASREEITRAHRALMKKLHPDHGGSTNLAARVNEAKDVLMRRHP